MSIAALVPGGLSPELDRLVRRAGLRAIPAEVLAWSVAERAFTLRPWPLQKRYLGGLAEPGPFEDASSRETGQDIADQDAAYQDMAEHALLRIARGIAPECVPRLVRATLAARGRAPLPARRLVACIADLAPFEIELLRLFAADREDPHSRPDLILGARAARLDSERAVDAAAERLHARGLVDGNPDIMPDLGRRSLMPRPLTELGRALLSLAPPDPLSGLAMPA